MTIQAARFRLATPDDVHLHTYDNTKLVAMNTCPTWGVLRYDMHKQMPGSGRAMALEAGQAMHDVFAWVRLLSWNHQRHERPTFDEAFWFHGERLFGGDRTKAAVGEISFDEDISQQAKMSALNILETTGFYDDPRDRRRTMSNLEECVLAYIDRWRWNEPVWMRHADDPMGDIGIEIPFDLVVEVDRPDICDTPHMFRLTGKIDGIHVHNGKITLHENKTASRLSEAWSMSFSMSSQVTGYCVAASTFTQESVRNAIIHGLAIPLPKSYDYGGVVREHVSRSDYQIHKWIEWLVHTIDMYECWRDNPYDAPRYTHSCNRYFRPCSFIPFCDTDPEDQRRVVQDMVTEEWSPLYEKTGD